MKGLAFSKALCFFTLLGHVASRPNLQSDRKKYTDEVITSDYSILWISNVYVISRSYLRVPLGSCRYILQQLYTLLMQREIGSCEPLHQVTFPFSQESFL